MPAEVTEASPKVQPAPPIETTRAEEKPPRAPVRDAKVWEIDKLIRDPEQRKRIEAPEIRAVAPAAESRRPVAKVPDPRPADPVREKEKAARDLQDRKRAEEAETEERRAAQDAAAERVLEEGRRRRAAEAERKRIAAQKAQERARPIAAPPKIEPQPEIQPAESIQSAPSIQPAPSAEAGGSIAGGIAIFVVAIAFANVVGFFAGKFSAMFLSSDSFPASLRTWTHLYPIAACISYGVGTLFGKVADVPELRFSAYLIWPGFLIGFCFFNGLPTQAEPSIWLAIVMIVAFVIAMLTKSREASSETASTQTAK